jgi:hypothetical protein
MHIIISAGHTLPAEFGPEPTEGSYNSHASPLPHPTWSPGPITPHNLPDNLSSLSLTHEGSYLRVYQFSRICQLSTQKKWDWGQSVLKTVLVVVELAYLFASLHGPFRKLWC